MRNNHFALLRMLAAIAVLVSHGWPLAYGYGTPDPLNNAIGISLGAMALYTFFGISGYFISQSFENRRSIGDFVLARVLRLYPALVVVVVLCVAVLGPLCTTLPIDEYLSARETWLYVPQNLTLKFMQFDLPGVFTTAPFANAVNGSLWSLWYEVVCYGLVVMVCLRRAWFIPFLVAYAIVYVALSTEAPLDHWLIVRMMVKLTLPFVTGMAIHRFRVRLHPVMAVIGLGLASRTYGTQAFLPCLQIAWVYAVFCLGFIRCRPVALYNRLGDYSYGVYVYAFPITQVIEWLFPGMTPLVLAGLAFPVTMVFAVASWHLIEAPALALRMARPTILNIGVPYAQTQS